METMTIRDLQQAMEGANPDARLVIDWKGCRIFEPVEGPVEVSYTPPYKSKARVGVFETGQQAYYLETGEDVPIEDGYLVDGVYRHERSILVTWERGDGYSTQITYTAVS